MGSGKSRRRGRIPLAGTPPPRRGLQELAGDPLRSLGLDPGPFASAVWSEQALGGEDGVPRIRMWVRYVMLLLWASYSPGTQHTVRSQLISCLL